MTVERAKLCVEGHCDKVAACESGTAVVDLPCQRHAHFLRGLLHVNPMGLPWQAAATTVSFKGSDAMSGRSARGRERLAGRRRKDAPRGPQANPDVPLAWHRPAPREPGPW